MRRTAALLRRPAGLRKDLPRLLFFTDPARTPDTEAIAAGLPAGAAVVFRHFGSQGAEAEALRLLAIARARRLRLLIGADPVLAGRVGAHGVHLPERMAAQARRLKGLHPNWLVTAAAHSAMAVRRAAGADAVVVSAIFPSRSPSAGAPLGAVRLAGLARASSLPLYALGGVNDETAARLLGAGVTGLAAVDGLRT